MEGKTFEAAKNYTDWMRAVGDAARRRLAPDYEPIAMTARGIRVSIVYFYTEQPALSDIDSMVKPTLDGMGNAADPNNADQIPVVWVDDRIVDNLIVERVDLSEANALESIDPIVLTVLESKPSRGEALEFLYVRVDRN